MINIYCILERIGGISGRRIQIRRIEKIKRNKDRTDHWFLVLNSKSDVLKLKDESRNLDEFLGILRRQRDPKETGRNGDEFIIGLGYEGGEVVHVEEIKINDMVKIIRENKRERSCLDFDQDIYLILYECKECRRKEERYVQDLAQKYNCPNCKNLFSKKNLGILKDEFEIHRLKNHFLGVNEINFKI